MAGKLESIRFAVPRVPRIIHAAYFTGALFLVILTIKSSSDGDVQGMYRYASLTMFLVFIEMTYVILRLLARVKKIEGVLKDFYSPAINDLRRDFYETQDLHLRHLEKLLIRRNGED
jgi:hypothetical protein